jgi:hypothetical protein
MDNEERQFTESWLEENPDISEKEMNFWHYVNWPRVYNDICRDYVAAFDDYIDLGLGLTFSDMSSPREYNFETDRIFAHISDESVLRLWEMTDKDELRKVMRERHTSYDGFYSHYSNDLDDWGNDPLEYDHNQLMTLLLANIPDFDDWDIFEGMAEQYYKYFDSAVDWEGFEEHIQEIREEREANDRRAKPIPRCTQTIEMEF